MAAVDVAVAPPHEFKAPVPTEISSDMPQRAEKYFGMRAFGCGAELFPFLGRREARALRLLNELMHAVIDRRAWVCIFPLGCVSYICVSYICVFVCVCLCVCLCI